MSMYIKYICISHMSVYICDIHRHTCIHIYIDIHRHTCIHIYITHIYRHTYVCLCIYRINIITRIYNVYYIV